MRCNKTYLCLVVILLSSFFILLYQNRERFENKYTLSLLIICKNEGMIIDEFVQHYKWQGIEHIYLIDNGSTDNMKEVLAPYINEGYISYYYLPEQQKQIVHYNTVYKMIRYETKWLIVCDADEYIYNTNKNDTILSYISLLPNTINRVFINWKMYSSSGFITQPESIRKSFIWRRNSLDKDGKCIINTKYTNSLAIHYHNHDDAPSENIDINNPPELKLNHYTIMSKEYFTKIKTNRGDAYDNSKKRDITYFESYDKSDSEVIDEDLKNLLE